MKQSKNTATAIGMFFDFEPIENGVATTEKLDKDKIKKQSIEFIAKESVRMGLVELRRQE
jgi:hypothetical protein